MVTIFGYSFPLPSAFNFLDPSFVSFFLTALAWALIAVAAYFVLTYLLRFFTRRQPGEMEDILLGIVRRPLMLLIVAFGIVNSVETLPLQSNVAKLLENAFKTILILAALYVVWRMIKDIVLYYGKTWARRTDSKIDDNLIPVMNVFGPVFIIITGILIIPSVWGYNISAVLVGAGVVGLVIGLALQDSLSNLFSGMSLVVEAPFRIGDLIMLPDGSSCEVQSLGLRSTRLYSLDIHSSIFMPNKTLANSQIINITQPTVEQRTHIDLTLGINVNMTHTQVLLERMAICVPGVLVDNLDMKIQVVQERAQEMREQAEQVYKDSLAYARLLEEVEKYQHAVIKLDAEREFNRALHTFQSNLETLFGAIQEREKGGLNAEELRELAEKYVAPCEHAYRKLIKYADAWATIKDAWDSDAEQQVVYSIWTRRNERLGSRWHDLKENLSKPPDALEMRLDDETQGLIDWLRREYKILPESWKNPKVTFKQFDGNNASLQLWFYIDNIRLEHDGRLQRIKTDIGLHIREHLSEEAIWS